MKEKPYPAGHNWEGLTPSQVNEGYKKKNCDNCYHKELPSGAMPCRMCTLNSEVKDSWKSREVENVK